MPRIAQLTAPGKIQIQDSPSLMAGPGETIIQVKHYRFIPLFVSTL